MHELLQASGYAALVYFLFSYLISFGSGQPLVEWINPGRRFLPLLALVLVAGAYSLLARAVLKYHNSHANLLAQLVNEEKAQSEVVGAMSFVVFAATLLMLYAWCWWNLPRHPRTFSTNPRNLVREYTRALRHYVRWKGGLDYAFLYEICNGTGRVVAEGAKDKDILRGLYRLPEVPDASIDADPRKAVAGQKQLWQQEAERIFRDLPRFDELLKPIRQGANVTFCFDVSVGAVYLEVVVRPHGSGDPSNAMYLFAATLNEHEVEKMTAGKHFYALSEAVHHIRRGVTKG
jgi:hypothetical protein